VDEQVLAATPLRRRNAARTRERILAAATEVFSTRDYTQARLADIAAAAGINQALVVRYYGSKDRLFETALAALLEANSVDQVRSAETFGVDIVRRLLGEDGGPRDPLPMVIHATSDPVAQAIAQRLMIGQILQPLAVWLGGEGAQARAAEVLLLCAGLFTYRTLLPLPALVGPMAPEARRWLEEALQALVAPQK
jgi:AcrR family transcriptional regulator